MYQALYRKYRPQTFDDVIGQKHITEPLKNQVMSGRLSHAYIFIGTRGTGKTTCARILAKAVNCEKPVNGNPCCQCASCRGIADGSIMDIVELDAASNNGVDNVRALRDEASFSPANARKRVYIIDEVHMLSTPAFNALLKILEEPPEHLIFVLATTELQKVPATILSRCQRHTFKRIDTAQLADYLETIAKKENIDLSHDASLLLAGLGEGSVRDALSMLDQCSAVGHVDVEEVYSSLGLAGNKRIVALLNHIALKDAGNAIADFDAMWNDGKDPAVVLKELSNLSRDILMTKVAPKGAEKLVYSGYETADIESIASVLSVSELIFIGEEIQKTLGNLVNPKINTELCIIKLASLNCMSEPQPVIGRNTAEKRILPQEKSVAAIETEADNVMREPPVLKDIVQAAPAEVPVKDEPHSDKPDLAGDEADFWHNVCSLAKLSLPKHVVMELNNTDVVIGVLEGNTLNLKVQPGFHYGIFNKTDVLDTFSKAASKVAGRDIVTRISELNSGSAAHHNLDELKNFSQVKFV